ncbi:hypothetical protein EVAR_18263_1 [Eumeta japonica]|uniref:BED-type domain-containing protein n=1 Tax=Eumeta variegata TaxID=151549 RepID=A0A4C1UKY6_EUMVA|nr:hypothetical protein EVAR_18263_1 [Eumeta japonica]
MAGDFVKHKKDSDMMSVWSYFLVAKDGNSAKCKRCPSILKTLGGSTKGLHTHLSTKHNIKVISASTSQDTENLNTAPPPAKRKLDDYFTKTKSDDDNLDDVLARMIALDGFPFSVFITSDNLRKLLLAKYTDLPKSAVTIQKRVMNYSEKKKQVTSELKHLKVQVGRLVCAEQQLCLAHGINLAVCDVLLQKHNYLQDSPTSDDMDDNNDDDHLEDLDCSESEDVEFELVNKIVDVLTPIKLTVEAICRRDANLCTADAALNFLIKQLSSKTQHLPKIKTCLVDRIKQRRSDNLTGVLNYLQNPRKDEENQLLSELEWHNLFPVPTQALLRKQIKSIVKRLNSRDDTEEEERSESLTDVELRPETSQPQLTLKEKLQLEIDKSMKSPDPEIQVQNESG